MKYSVVVARSPSDDSAVVYILPVLWMTSCFDIMGQIQMQTIGKLFTVTCQVARKRSLLFRYSALLLTCCFKLPDDRQAYCGIVVGLYMCAWHGWFVCYSCDDRNVSSYNKILTGSEASIIRRASGRDPTTFEACWVQPVSLVDLTNIWQFADRPTTNDISASVAV